MRVCRREGRRASRKRTVYLKPSLGGCVEETSAGDAHYSALFHFQMLFVSDRTAEVPL